MRNSMDRSACLVVAAVGFASLWNAPAALACTACGNPAHRPAAGSLSSQPLAAAAAGGELLQPVTANASLAGIPALSSRPGAAYTIYLNFGGFDFTGVWGGSTTGTPTGSFKSYDRTASGGTAPLATQNAIRSIWAQSAEKYAAMNVNVTTVDPAVAAGQAASDAGRQAYYDSQARLMHTVVTGSTPAENPFIGGGGVSYVGVTQFSYSAAGINGGAGRGYHTNFSYVSGVGSGANNLSEVNGHENGHGLGLSHQHAYLDGTLTAEYGNNGGNAQYAPIMGVSYSTARGVFRKGPVGVTTAGNPATYVIQNDVATILNNNLMSFVDDGVGHGVLDATPLALTGTGALQAGVNDGYIAPIAIAGATLANRYEPIGESNYTRDFFSFTTAGGAFSLTINESGDLVAEGLADGNGTLDSILRLLRPDGSIVASATNPNSQTSTIAATLAAGLYYVQVASAGGKQATASSNSNEPATYFDMGSYFLSGSVAVPEPASLAALVLFVAAAGRRRSSTLRTVR